MSSYSNYSIEDPFEAQWILLIRLENVVANKFNLYKNLRKRFDTITGIEAFTHTNNVWFNSIDFPVSNENQIMKKFKSFQASLDDAENSLLEFMSLTNLVFQDPDTDEYQLDSIFEHFDTFLLTLESLYHSLNDLQTELIPSTRISYTDAECISEICIRWREMIRETEEWLSDIHLIFGRFKRTRSLIEMILMQSVSICMKYKSQIFENAQSFSCKQKLIFWINTVESWRDQADTLCVEVASKAGHRKASSDMIGLRHRFNNLLKCLRRQLELFDPCTPFMGYNNSAKTTTSEGAENKTSIPSSKPPSTIVNQYSPEKKAAQTGSGIMKGMKNSLTPSTSNDSLDEFTDPLSEYNIKRIYDEFKEFGDTDVDASGEAEEDDDFENKPLVIKKVPDENDNLENAQSKAFFDCRFGEGYQTTQNSDNFIGNLLEQRNNIPDDSCDSSTSDESVITQIEKNGSNESEYRNNICFRQRNLNNENNDQFEKIEVEKVNCPQGNQHNQQVQMHVCHSVDDVRAPLPRELGNVQIPQQHKKWLGINFITNFMVAPTDYLFLGLIFLTYLLLSPECKYLYECLNVSIYYSRPPPV